MKTIVIGADHAGFELKEKLKKYLSAEGYAIHDCGTFSKDAVDYPVIAVDVAALVAESKYDVGIIIDGAGIGSAIVANKIPGIRAALCHDISTAKNSREHNNANILTLGGGLIGFELAKQMIDIWLKTECTADRHLRRVKMIDEIDSKKTPAIVSSLKNPSLNSTFHAMVTDADLQQIASQIKHMLSSSSGMVFTGEPANCAKASCNSCGHCADQAPQSVRQFIGYGAARVSNTPDADRTPQDLAKYIDHTLLKPEASETDIKKLCQEAAEHHFATVCVNPSYVKLAYEMLKDTDVKVCSVVGFPLGANALEIKSLEARRAIREGAREIDMVIHVGALKSKNYDLVYRDIRAVVDSCIDGSAICKVIIEAALLTDDEKIKACEISKQARAHYVKTSTGFGPGGATAHDVELMRQVVSGTSIGVKAAGGIRSYEDAQKMIKAGATRIGASAGVKILQEAGQGSK